MILLKFDLLAGADFEALEGVATEALGIFVVWVVLDWFRKREATEQQLRRDEESLRGFQASLVRQARSRNNNNALDAIEYRRR